MAETPHTKPLHERAVGELVEFLVLAAYLYICFSALLFLKTAILEGAGISYSAWGIAAIKALLLAKFMLVGRAAGIGEKYRHRPLIWPTLYKSLMFFLFLLALTTIEEAVVGYFRGRDFATSIAHVAGPTLAQGVAASLILFLILVPYFAFRSLGDVFGDRQLIRIFFVDRAPSAGPL